MHISLDKPTKLDRALAYPMRQKARGMAQHGGPPGWVAGWRKVTQLGVIL